VRLGQEKLTIVRPSWCGTWVDPLGRSWLHDGGPSFADPDAATLANLVHLQLTSIGASCAAPTAVLPPPGKLPISVKSKAKLQPHRRCRTVAR
jgi:hypothetical protein